MDLDERYMAIPSTVYSYNFIFLVFAPGRETCRKVSSHGMIYMCAFAADSIVNM